jgi:hypothetical protein
VFALLVIKLGKCLRGEMLCLPLLRVNNPDSLKATRVTPPLRALVRSIRKMDSGVEPLGANAAHGFIGSWRPAGPLL